MSTEHALEVCDLSEPKPTGKKDTLENMKYLASFDLSSTRNNRSVGTAAGFGLAEVHGEGAAVRWRSARSRARRRDPCVARGVQTFALLEVQLPCFRGFDLFDPRVLVRVHLTGEESQEKQEQN